MQPMLASRELPDLTTLRYPIFASPKLDGCRALVKDGKLLSRALLPFPNRFVTARYSFSRHSGLDGELILGDPTSETCFRDTSAALRRIEGEPDVKFYAFDDFSKPGLPYDKRIEGFRYSELDFERVEHRVLYSEECVLAYEKEKLDQGFEGLILRDPNGPYKFGRATLKEGWLMKLKRFVDGEAKVVGFLEELHNANPATKNKLGRTKRSTHQANMVGKGTLGAFLCESDDFPGYQFEVGVGLTDEFAAWAWAHRTELMGAIIKYKHFPKGGKDRPRHAVFLGMRDKWDL